MIDVVLVHLLKRFRLVSVLDLPENKTADKEILTEKN
jgi:hypothetical protein